MSDGDGSSEADCVSDYSSDSDCYVREVTMPDAAQVSESGKIAKDSKSGKGSVFSRLLRGVSAKKSVTAVALPTVPVPVEEQSTVPYLPLNFILDGGEM